MKTKYLNVKQINEKIVHDNKSFVDSCEESYRVQLERVADEILSRKNPVRIVLLGGPSCAGKTTSARILDELMTEKGKNVVPIEMDNFFITGHSVIATNGSLDGFF